MDGIVSVDTGYIRQSAAEIGGLLQDAVSAQIEEVRDIMEIQAQTVQAGEMFNAVADSLEGTINILA